MEGHTDVFDPRTTTFTPGPRLAATPWYPTSVSMPSDIALIMGGGETRDVISPTRESYDPVAGTMRTLPRTAARISASTPACTC